MTTEEIIRITEQLRHGCGHLMPSKEEYREMVLYWQREAWIEESGSRSQAQQNFEWYTKAKALERKVEELERKIESMEDDAIEAADHQEWMDQKESE